MDTEAYPSADLKKSRRRKPANTDALKIDRLPPHSIEAEQGVLGCFLIKPKECVGDAITQGVKVEWFYDLRHQVVFELLVEMWDAKEAMDMITINQRLKNKNQLEGVGGVAYLSSMVDAVPSAENLTYYIGILKDKFVRRLIIQKCTDLVVDTYENEDDTTQEVLDAVDTELMSIRAAVTVGREQRTVKELVNDAISKIEEYHQRQGQITGLTTGFPDLDKMTTGLKGGEMVVIAARPSMGKTSLAMNIGEHVTVDQKIPAAVFSLEMTSESLILRMLTSRARVNIRNIHEGFLAERDFPKLTGAATKIANAPLYVDDTSGISIMELKARARRMYHQYGVRLFIIDYLQLLRSTNKRAEKREQEIADISHGVKDLAKELNVPVIVLSQLNRELEKDKHRKPRLSDLRESGAIEQDADLVAMLYKVKTADDEDVEEGDAIPVNLLIAKQRNGPTGDVHLTFLKSFTRFESAAKVWEQDMPI